MKESPLVFVNSFSKYLESIFEVLFNCSYFKENCCRYANKTIIDVLDIDFTRISQEHTKLSQEVQSFLVDYEKIFQDCNIHKILNFIVCNYLLISSIEGYGSDPESNASMFQHELQILEKIANNFYTATLNWLSDCLTYIIDSK